CQQYNSLPFIF
nr:immunoglobulin light chain junction region [Macaca mulatta]MOX53900.1 immunoglobulin light chain junction region [Macaca mulatta]MOX54558.1 immunoglobulin light chain junction region [Macaca mulatta]MOX55614.1 immunoglobulin light chain junction region [Macaca mulatta]MOX55879.1 immunoglobulin light chain junction region [Macaca mulatta]